jgi:hypothetical protein
LDFVREVAIDLKDVKLVFFSWNSKKGSIIKKTEYAHGAKKRSGTPRGVDG